MPATKAEATWSAQPATTGVPAARPVAAAAARVTSPITSCERLRRAAAARGSMWPSATSVGIDPAAREVQEAGFERPVVLDDAGAGQPPVDVVVGAEARSRCCANTSGSWRSSQRSLGATSCWLTPLPVRRTNAAASTSAASSATSAPGAAVALLDAAPQQPPVGIEQNDGRQHAGDADGGDVRSAPACRREQLAERSRRCCPTTAPGPPRPSPAVPSRASTGRCASASVCARRRRSGCRSSRSCRCRCRAISAIAQRSVRDLVHEAPDAVAVDRRPGVAVAP